MPNSRKIIACLKFPTKFLSDYDIYVMIKTDDDLSNLFAVAHATRSFLYTTQHETVQRATDVNSQSAYRETGGTERTPKYGAAEDFIRDLVKCNQISPNNVRYRMALWAGAAALKEVGNLEERLKRIRGQVF